MYHYLFLQQAYTILLEIEEFPERSLFSRKGTGIKRSMFFYLAAPRHSEYTNLVAGGQVHLLSLRISTRLLPGKATKGLSFKNNNRK
jgi:hypothetical protein